MYEIAMINNVKHLVKNVGFQKGSPLCFQKVDCFISLKAKCLFMVLSRAMHWGEKNHIFE